MRNRNINKTTKRVVSALACAAALAFPCAHAQTLTSNSTGTHDGYYYSFWKDNGDASFKKALEYMQVTPGQPLSTSPVDVVFVGSCTNSRITDMQQAADVLRGRKVAAGVRMLVVPGSQQIKKEAESLGLDRVFVEAGAEWRESGCSMCLGMNGDTVPSGQLSVLI